MKNRFFSRFNFLLEKTQSVHVPLWTGVHLLLVLLPFLFGTVSVTTDLSSILPATSNAKNVAAVEKKISSRLNGGFYILVGHADFYTARETAAGLVNSIKEHGGFQTLNFDIEGNSLAKLQEFLFDYRYQLLSPEVRRELLDGKVEELSEQAYMLLSSPVSMGGLDHLNLDPFLLADSSLRYFLESGLIANMKIGLRDGVLASEYDGKSWVLISGTVTGSGLSVDTANSLVGYIHACTKELKKNNMGLEFAFSGAPFHSYDSAEKSGFEITLLSSISMVFIIFMVLFVFRSVKPLAATASAIVMGIVSGLAASFLFFQNVHILTIVFGTSLIGISLDYALHYFSTWALSDGQPGGRKNIQMILPGISIGLLTTCTSYLGFVFTAFPLLQQMAVFSMTGLISSWLTVILIFPRLKPARNTTASAATRIAGLIHRGFLRIQCIPRPIKFGVAIALSILIVSGSFQLHLENNIRDFYHMSDELKHHEAAAAAVLRHGTTGAYILTDGASPEDCRQKEERIIGKLSESVQAGGLEGYLCSVQFVPSMARQKANYLLAEAVMEPSVPTQLKLLGFSPADVEQWKADFKRQENKVLAPVAFESLPLGRLYDTLWIGDFENRFYSMTMLFGVSDPGRLQAVAESEGAWFVNKVQEINTTLQSLSILALVILALSYLVIFLGLLKRYGLIRGFQIVFIPGCAGILALIIMNLSGMPFNLFSVIGLILVPGMGTDYVIFFTEGRNHSLPTVLAIFLSMLTTVLSFGLLGFTTLAGVFGLTVALGVFLSFLLTPFLIGRQNGPLSGGQG